MAYIQTVTGRIAPEELGLTYTHEHLLCDQRLCRQDGLRRPGSEGNLMVLDDIEVAIGEMRAIRALGADALVEVTMQAWGRDLPGLRRISEASGIKIIATSGFYVEHCHPGFVAEQSIEQLAEGLVREITEGVDRTGIRTGLLKSAISRPVVEGPEEKCARAVARAQRATGASITTHTSGGIRFEIPGGNIGMQLLDLFEAEGVDPRRVIVGHVDENADIRFLEAMCRRGAFVQFDVVGKWHWMLDETRADLMAALADRGYIDHLLLSTDRARKAELKSYGGIGYAYLLTHFVPLLRKAGLSEEDIRRIMVENPRRALAIHPPPS
ncbi:MAG: phosphotriesterase-related protein [Armatimonadetes bacterium]|nr:phosphotriesterase-related protein [Armatimonadota bacterium]